jgi:predicted O-methyltransferase YrrM
MPELHVFLSATAACGAVAAVAVGFLVLRRQRAAERQLTQRLDRLEGPALDNLYSQLEALNNLYRDLGFKASLPGTRGWAACPDFLHLIALHVLAARPAVAVECSSGVSTLVLAQCMAANGSGHVFSLEHEPQFAEKTREHLARLGLQEFATVIDAPLKVYALEGCEYRWYDLSKLVSERIDLLVIDGPPAATCPMARYPAGPLLFCRLTEGAHVFLDDAARDEEKAAVDRWSRAGAVSIVERLLRTEKGCSVLVRGPDASGVQRC